MLNNASTKNDGSYSKQQLRQLAPILVVVALCWFGFLLNSITAVHSLNHRGVVPRHLSSLPAIIWAPFMHASFTHLAANTPPLLILGAILCARSRTEFTFVTLCGTLFGGGLIWLAGRHASHIGASGLIFCYFGYMVSAALFKRTLTFLLLSIVCTLAYGAMLKGLLPGSGTVSWESHLAGFAAGILAAWLLNRAVKLALTMMQPNAVASGIRPEHCPTPSDTCHD